MQFLKSYKIKMVLLILILVNLGCSNENGVSAVDQIDSKNSKIFDSIESVDQLAGLDQELTPKQLSQMNSDDSQYDIEDIEEIKTRKNKILIVGDSWAFFPCAYGSLGKALRQLDAPIINDSRCLRTSQNGGVAHNWLTQKQHLRAVDYIKNNSRIKVIYLTLGGNDMMASWTVNSTPAQEKVIFEKIYNDIQKVIDAYLAVRPDIKIVLSGYDYPHFTDNHFIKIYRRVYDKIGKPEFKTINQVLVNFSKYMVPIANNKNVFYIHHLGLSQYFDGVPEFDFPAKASKHPSLISPMSSPGDIGGNPDLPSSKKSMINWLFLVRDAYHLHHSKYVELMKHTYENVLVNIID